MKGEVCAAAVAVMARAVSEIAALEMRSVFCNVYCDDAGTGIPSWHSYTAPLPAPSSLDDTAAAAAGDDLPGVQVAGCEQLCHWSGSTCHCEVPPAMTSRASRSPGVSNSVTGVDLPVTARCSPACF